MNEQHLEVIQLHQEVLRAVVSAVTATLQTDQRAQFAKHLAAAAALPALSQSARNLVAELAEGADLVAQMGGLPKPRH